MKTTIQSILNSWVLTIESDDQIMFARHGRLIELIDLACTLKLHVDNISTLPLNQYQVIKSQGVV